MKPFRGPQLRSWYGCPIILKRQSLQRRDFYDLIPSQLMRYKNELRRFPCFENLQRFELYVSRPLQEMFADSSFSPSSHKKNTIETIERVVPYTELVLLTTEARVLCHT
ncbi:hypothetical protein HZ326_2211 [Fusarium oxysporum f. sp. albedinis]|nr:hypothetical protein HZ326_2211 [Fusarium oxysporum f. sp. albedinis]